MHWVTAERQDVVTKAIHLPASGDAAPNIAPISKQVRCRTPRLLAQLLECHGLGERPDQSMDENAIAITHQPILTYEQVRIRTGRHTQLELCRHREPEMLER